MAKLALIVVFTTVVRDEEVVFSTDYSQPERQVIIEKDTAVTPGGEVMTTDCDATIITTYESKPITLELLQRLYVVDIVDAEIDVLLWRGYMKSDDVALQEDGLIEEHIERIVEKLPRS